MTDLDREPTPNPEEALQTGFFTMHKDKEPTLAEVGETPAPWTLTGDAYIVISRMPYEQTLHHSFIPSDLRSKLKSIFSMTMFVNYQSSNVGPYKELLYIPGQFSFTDEETHLSISKIYVSTWESVLNGKINWGIPKERADFNVEKIDHNREKIAVSKNGQLFAEFDFQTYGLTLPISTAMIPQRFRSLAQDFGGKLFQYNPTSKGKMSYGKVLHSNIDGKYFPDLSKGKILGVMRYTDFTMNFPISKIIG